MFAVSPTGACGTQTTTEWATLIGPKDQRVWVGTEFSRMRSEMVQRLAE
jgi:hypothetical protein